MSDGGVTKSSALSHLIPSDLIDDILTTDKKTGIPSRALDIMNQFLSDLDAKFGSGSKSAAGDGNKESNNAGDLNPKTKDTVDK